MLVIATSDIEKLDIEKGLVRLVPYGELHVLWDYVWRATWLTVAHSTPIGISTESQNKYI